MSQSTLAIVLAKGDHHEHAIKHTAEDLWFLPAVHKHQKQECHLFILIQPTKPTWQSSYIGHHTLTYLHQAGLYVHMQMDCTLAQLELAEQSAALHEIFSAPT